MRPRRLAELVGQPHLTGEGSLLRQAIEEDRLFSIILWGPPGCGKTTLAGIIANTTKSAFVRISAVLSGVKDIRQVIESAQKQRDLYGKRTILFVDEIHRFNKAQQDAFLHHVENGLITLVGATTQNPSFEVIPALVSRCRVFTLNRLEDDAVVLILKRALSDAQRGLGMTPDSVSPDALAHMAGLCDGDARMALANLETVASHLKDQTPVTLETMLKVMQKKSLHHDKGGEAHYNLISAFIKSLRASDPDAALYWMERMLSAGDDPYYLLRRMVRFATEDIGMADPGALTMTVNADMSFRMLGPPEGNLSLYQAAIYLATAPKSNAVYMAEKQVKKKVAETGSLPVPMHIRNAPTKLMKDLGYGKGYQYPHDFSGGFAGQACLPDTIQDARFYQPTGRGYEKTIRQKMQVWESTGKKDRHS